MKLCNGAQLEICGILISQKMNRDSEKGIFTKVKIQVRVSDLIKVKGQDGQKVFQKRDEANSSGGGATNNFDHCQLKSVPKIKIDEETNNYFAIISKSSVLRSPRAGSAPENGESDKSSSLRRQSVASSAPAIKESDLREERPVLRKCLSLRGTRQDGRHREVQENEIVR